jgi:hypothetical protein
MGRRCRSILEFWECECVVVCRTTARLKYLQRSIRAGHARRPPRTVRFPRLLVRPTEASPGKVSRRNVVRFYVSAQQVGSLGEAE